MPHVLVVFYAGRASTLLWGVNEEAEGPLQVLHVIAMKYSSQDFSFDLMFLKGKAYQANILFKAELRYIFFF